MSLVLEAFFSSLVSCTAYILCLRFGLSIMQLGVVRTNLPLERIGGVCATSPDTNVHEFDPQLEETDRTSVGRTRGNLSSILLGRKRSPYRR